jgi:hypothetical protein
MITIPLTEETRQKAKTFIDQYMPISKLKDYSTRGWFYEREKIMSDASLDPNYVGLLGEIAVYQLNGMTVNTFFDKRSKFKSDDGFDINLNGETYDIKTLRSKIYPRDDYRFNVITSCEKKIKNRGYIFNSLLSDESAIVVVGFIAREEFFQKAKFHLKGETVAKNGFVFPCDAYDISINDLKHIEILFSNERTVEKQQIKKSTGLVDWL